MNLIMGNNFSDTKFGENIPDQWKNFEHVIQRFSITELVLLMKYKGLAPTTPCRISNEKTTLLNYIAHHGRLSLLKILIEGFKANPNCEWEGKTPLISAALGKSIQNFEFLLGLPSIDVNLTTRTQFHAVLESAKEGREEIFKAMLRRNIDVSLICEHLDQVSKPNLEEWYSQYVKKKRAFLVWSVKKQQLTEFNIPRLLVKEITLYL